MSKTAQFFLSILVLVTIGANIFAFGLGSGPLFIFARLLLMPAVVGLTFIVLTRARQRELKRRFPGSADPPAEATDDGEKD